MNLYGWDTIYAVGLDQVNRQLAANPNLTDRPFSFETAPPHPVKVEGKFGPWRVVGGSGQLLHLELPIRSGTLTVGGGAPAKPVDLAGAAVQLEVGLKLLPAAANARELRFDFRSVGGTPGQGGPGVVTPLRAVDPGRRLPFEATALLPAAVAGCLVANAAALSHVFATVNLVPPGSDSWLAPVSCGFCYHQSQDGTTGRLVLLGATDGRDTAGLPRQIDGDLPTVGARCFGVSPNLLLRHVVRPQLPTRFGHGTTAATFRFDEATSRLVNTAPFPLNETQVAAFKYYPQVLLLGVEWAGNDLATGIVGTCDLYLGFRMDFHLRATSTASYDPRAAAIVFAPGSQPVSGYNLNLPDLPDWVKALMGPVGAVFAIAEAIVRAVADGLTNALRANAGTVSFAAAPAQSVRWHGLEEFRPTGGALKGALLLWGD